MKKQFANKNKFQQNDRPKNKTITFDLPATYTANRGKEIDTEQVVSAFNFLSNNEVFGMLSTSVQISKATMFGDESKKGFMNIGFINDVNMEDNVMTVTVYGSYADKIEDLVNAYRLQVVPRIICDRDGDFVAFTNFDLVPTVE